MPVFPIYRDFLRFLEALSRGAPPWEAYVEYYARPHRRFLGACWEAFGIDEEALRARVERVRRGHYSLLEGLLWMEEPEDIVLRALGRCFRLTPPPEEPEVYLTVGFFSPDAFVLKVGGKPKIGFGLERFQDFRLLGLLVAHEYAHWLRRMLRGFPEEENWGERLVSEGLAVFFSGRAFPGTPPYRLLRLPRARWNWCLENEALLWERVAHEVIFGEELPPRTWTYIAYRLIQSFDARREHDLRDLLTIPPEEVLSRLSEGMK
ncbi:MAG TPA: hypothetical protein EYP17_01990 [Candidatus Latescibacteria bacterium]|nr:hypothetical protein [Candidatus Latescibacterota bacterium]